MFMVFLGEWLSLNHTKTSKTRQVDHFFPSWFQHEHNLPQVAHVIVMLKASGFSYRFCIKQNKLLKPQFSYFRCITQIQSNFIFIKANTLTLG